MDIVELIRDRVKKVDIGKTIPAVCISGGIDSTVILYHVISDLMDGIGSNVCTFTATFGNDEDETDKARRVADYYGTTHKEVLITKMDVLSMLRLILQYYPFPRFNIWPWILINKIKLWNHSHLFIGEGADELFGYSDRSFLEGWVGQLVWVQPAWKVPCDYFNIKLNMPFMEIQEDSIPTLKYYKPPHKEILRYAYRGILPDFVINQMSTSPGIGFYKMMGMSREELQIKVAEAWLESRNEIHTRTYECVQS